MKPTRGIRRTARGWRAWVGVRGVMYSKRFPPTATLTEMKEWREDTRSRVRAGAVVKRSRSGSPSGFAADADRYLKAVRAMTTYGEREKHIAEWVAVFGDRPRGTIRADEIAAQLHRWRDGGLAASTVNHRRTALMHLWTVLDGRAERNPVRDAPKFREPTPEPRAMPLETVEAILGAMKDTVTRARLSVIAWTGLPHKSLMRLKPEHVDWEGRTLFVPGREKGRGTRGRRIPLMPEAVTALRALDRHDGWGQFSTDSVRKSWLEAALKIGLAKRDPHSTGATWQNILCPYRPYDLRHTFGTEAYRVSGDIRATQELLGHSTPTLTSRYTLGAVDDRVKAAVDAIVPPSRPRVAPSGSKLTTGPHHRRTRQR